MTTGGRTRVRWQVPPPCAPAWDALAYCALACLALGFAGSVLALIVAACAWAMVRGTRAVSH